MTLTHKPDIAAAADSAKSPQYPCLKGKTAFVTGGATGIDAGLVAGQAAVPGMCRLGDGSVINLGLIGGQIKSPDHPCHAVAKSSVNGLTRGLAGLLGKEGIRANTVTPGWVMTDRQQRLWLDAEGERDISRNQCLPGRLQPHHVASMVLFLASDAAAMCTAQAFVVDGG